MESRNGVFWIQGREDKRVPGLFFSGPRWPKLELLGSITDAYVDVANHGNYITRVPSPMGSENFTIHGIMGGRDSAVTIFEASTIKRTYSFFEGGPEKQVIEGRYALLGGQHVRHPQALFTKARMRVQNIDHWAALPGISGHFNSKRRSFGISYSPSTVPSTPLQDHVGRLSFSSHLRFSPPDPTGGRIERTTWLMLHFDGAYTVDSIRSKFLSPLSALATLLYGVDCPPTALEVFDEGQRAWLKVISYEITDDRTFKSIAPLLTLDELGHTCLANWFSTFESLTPLPRIIADTITENGRAVENRLMELAMAAEGLHRRIYPDSRRISEETVRECQAILNESALPGKVRKILSDALGQYLWDASFPMRIARLAEDASTAATEVCGRRNRWKAAITNARNGFAHSLPESNSPTNQIIFHATLVDSLRWMLTIRMLQECNLSNETISEALNRSDLYQRFLSQAKQHASYIYGTEDDRPQGV